MQLVITLRKDVADPIEGESIYDLVKLKLSDRPDIRVTGHVTNHFEPSYEVYNPLDGSEHEVLNVIDGDTIEINPTGHSETVRIIGIDTPETVHPGKPVQPGGPEATQRAKELLTGKRITIHYDPNPKHGRRCKYGRLLAYVELPDGRDFGLVMIQEGFAKAYVKYPFTRQKLYVNAERKRSKQ